MQPSAFNYFHKKTSSQMFDSDLKSPRLKNMKEQIEVQGALASQMQMEIQLHMKADVAVQMKIKMDVWKLLKML